MMETEVLDYKSPLYGRITAQWKYAKKYFQNWRIRQDTFIGTKKREKPMQYLLKP